MRRLNVWYCECSILAFNKLLIIFILLSPLPNATKNIILVASIHQNTSLVFYLNHNSKTCWKIEKFTIWMIGICWMLLVGFINPYLVYFPALFWIISNLRGKTLKVQGTLGDCISYVEKPGILELWYKKFNNEETPYQGKLYNTRQVKVIKLKTKNCRLWR